MHKKFEKNTWYGNVLMDLSQHKNEMTIDKLHCNK